MNNKVCKTCQESLNHKRFRTLGSKECERCRNRKYYPIRNAKKRANYDPSKKRAYYLKNKEKITKRTNKRHIERRREDLLYRLADYMRSRTRVALKQKRLKKSSKLSQYLGCTLEQFKVHLESKFIKGMSWDNYGDWHIDHIVPLASAKTEQEIYKLCHFSNLQPLWAEDNKRKGAKMTPFLIDS